MIRNIKGAIFDLDGTLLDSMEVWDTFGEDYLTGRGLTPPSGLREILKPLSMMQTAEYFIASYGVPDSPQQIIEEINRRIARHYEEVFELKPGVRAFLDMLKERGIPMCVATATDRPLVEPALKRLGIYDYFKAIFTCTELCTGKDCPDIYLKARELLGTELAHTYVFEDALHAALTAKKAGFPLVAVSDSVFWAEKEKLMAAADLYISSFTELVEKCRKGADVR